MTTVAYRDGWMVADSQISEGAMKYRAAKIERLADGRLVGMAGSWGGCIKLRDWVAAGCPDDDEPTEINDATLLVASERGLCLFDSDLVPFPILDAFAAVGSGAQYAVGAMEAGATAEDAVLIACRRDPGSSFPIHKLQFVGLEAKPAKRKRK